MRFASNVLGSTVLTALLCNGVATSQPNLRRRADSNNNGDQLPNIVVVMIDDLGHNQVGYLANPEGNNEIQTPNIDKHATDGIQIDRGYMTPWCAPSRAAFQTGSMNSFNSDVSNKVFSFDDSIGFVGGLQPGTVTLAHALKKYSASTGGQEYTTSYAGKWGIGGTAWTNTPMGVGYDSFLGYWGDSIESCDGLLPQTTVPGTDGAMMRAVPGYWKQDMSAVPNPLCDQLTTIDDQTLSVFEKVVACSTTPLKPSQIMDRDLLDHTTNLIRSHDYSSGPLYHMHATQILHLPFQYPEEYDANNTWYGDVDKPEADNEMLRLKTANVIKFMDDIFGEIMQSIKDAGQWDNTIVFFSSDNGGAIYSNSANNNWPLRGAKFSTFEGGLRVPQFLSGGWIDQHTTPNRDNKSETYVVVNDWAPTLLGMAGGDRSFLLGNVTGPAYGNNLWEHIQNSVNLPDQAANGANAVQLVRNVTYSPTLYLQIEESSTKKYFHTGGDKQYFARHWAPVWPTNDDLIPDFGYASIKPCRPNGEAMECCYFDIEADPNETAPLTTDCVAHDNYATESYYGDICDEPKNPLCATETNVTGAREQDVYSLWTLYDASGPFTNSTGFPINASMIGETIKCACSVVEEGTDPSNVDSFLLAVNSPALCFDSKSTSLSDAEQKHAYKCEMGDLARDPFDGDYLQSFADEGFDVTFLEAWFHSDWKGQATRFLGVPDLAQALHSYITRQGFDTFPNFGKFPFVAAGMDTCPNKGVTPIPVPVRSLTPWSFTQGDVTANAQAPKTLCSAYTAHASFCPSHQNPMQQLIAEFDYSPENPSFTFVNATVVDALSLSECEVACKASPDGTAYIGDGPFGMTM